ncbi:MAG: FUSC family protein [Ktedonobacteraceae bacterium]
MGSLYTDQKTGRASWLDLLKRSLKEVLRIDRSQITAFQALRGTIGIVIPLAIGVASGHVVEGVSMAGGAAIVATVGLTTTSRVRTRTMLLDCIGVALAAFVGSITGHIGWLSVLVVGIWGFGAGMMVAISPQAMILGLQSTLALIILTHFKLAPAQAAIQAMLMFAGALLQAILAIAPSPWNTTFPERSALFSVYQELADYASSSSKTQSGTQVRDALLKAQQTLADSNTQSQQGKIFSALLEEAEHIRLSLILLSRKRRHLAQNMTEQAALVAQLDQVMKSAAQALRKIAYEVKPPSKFTSAMTIQPHPGMKEALAALRKETRMAEHVEDIQQVLVYGDALRDQLHKARKLAKSWKYAHQSTPISFRKVPRQAYLQLNNARAILRANLNTHSATFRHAMRLGVALALATALYRLLPFPVGRGYWIPLTVLLVLRTDFASTFTRGLARLLGTILGAVLAVLLASFIGPTQGLLVIFVAVSAFVAFSFLFANYAIFSIFITMEIVFLLAFVIPQTSMNALDRAVDTTIGGILALIMYIVWPTWEHPHVAGNVADRFEAVRRYFVKVMECYIHPNAYDGSVLDTFRMKSRLARSNAAASVQRAINEPTSHHIDLELAQDLLGTVDTLIVSVLTLEAYLVDNPSHCALPMVSDFCNSVDEALRIMATAIREGQPIAGFPDLQEAFRRLQDKKSGSMAQGRCRSDLRFVVSEARRIAGILIGMKEMMGGELRR